MDNNSGAHSNPKLLDVMIPSIYESNDDMPRIDNVLQNTAADTFSTSKSIGVSQPPEVSQLSSTSAASTTRFAFRKEGSTSSVYSSSVLSGDGDSLNITLSEDIFDGGLGDHFRSDNHHSDPSATTQHDIFNSKEFFESCNAVKATPLESSTLLSIPGGIHIVSSSSESSPNVTPRQASSLIQSTEKALSSLTMSEGAPASLKSLSFPAPPARDSPRNLNLKSLNIPAPPARNSPRSSGVKSLGIPAPPSRDSPRSSGGKRFFRTNSGISVDGNGNSNSTSSNRMNAVSSILHSDSPALTGTPPPPEAPFHLMRNHFSSTMPIESITGLISSVLESISLGMLSRQQASTPIPETAGGSIRRKFSIEEDDRTQRMPYNPEESSSFGPSSTSSSGRERDLSAVPLRPAPCGGYGSGEFVYHYIEDQYLWKLVYSGSRSSDSCTCDIRVYLSNADDATERAPATTNLDKHSKIISPVASQATQAYGAPGNIYPTTTAPSSSNTVDARQLNQDEKRRFRRFSPPSGANAAASAAATTTATATEAAPAEGSDNAKKDSVKVDTAPAPSAGPTYIIEVHRLSGRCPMIPSLVQVLKSQLMGGGSGSEADSSPPAPVTLTGVLAPTKATRSATTGVVGVLAPVPPTRATDSLPSTPRTAAAESSVQHTPAQTTNAAGEEVLSPTSAITAAAAKVADTAPCYFHYLQLVRQMLAAATNAPTIALSPRPGLSRSSTGGFETHPALPGDAIQPSAGSDWEVQLCGCDALLELVTSARRAVNRNAVATAGQSGAGAGVRGKNAPGERLLSMVVDTGCVESLCRLLVSTFAQFTEMGAGGAVAVNASNSALRNSFHEQILGVGINTLVQLSAAHASPSLSRTNSGITVPVDYISQDLERESDPTDTIRRRILVAVLEKEGVLGMLWDLLLLMHPVMKEYGSDGEDDWEEDTPAAPTAEELSGALRLAPLRYRSATVLVNVYSSCAQGGSRGLIAGKAAEAARTYAPALADLCDEAVGASGASEPTLLLQPCMQLLSLITPGAAV